jgi:hypothetical protein
MSWEALLDVDGNILQDADGNPLVSPYGPTKLDVIKLAYAMCGRNAFFDGELDESEIQTGLQFLTFTAADMEGNDGITIGFNYPDANAYGSPSDESGLARNAVLAVAGELAKLLADKMGKQLSAIFMARHTRALSGLTSRMASIPQMQMARGTPRGAGNRRSLSRLFITDVSPDEPVQ